MGREHALAFAREGANVVVNDICEGDPKVSYELGLKKQLDSTVEDVRKLDVKCIGTCADVSNSKQVQDMVKAALDSFGRIDILVNNAGITGKFSNVVDVPEELWDRAVAVNLRGTFLVTKYTLPSMIAHRYGRIVNISSIAGLVGLPGSSFYVATKHAVIGFTKTLAQEVGEYDITSNAVCPGLVDTPMLNFLKGQPNVRAARPPSGVFPHRPMIEPSEISGLVLWLSSDEAKDVTGAVFAMDQGFTAG
jgi:NAD(P)-dependent dehydrogenase (short-subunit alcohol dehydrogenase family)